MDKFNIIYADPAWQYADSCNAGNRGAVHKYNVMSVEDICKLPVANMAADDCVLFMWVTMPMLAEGLQVINAWGFTYKTCAFTWIKLNKKKPTPFMGMGRWTRSNSELCLLATKGKPKRLNAGISSIVMSPIEGHSKKPDIIRDKIVSLVGDLARIELFARQAAPGWSNIGDQLETRTHWWSDFDGTGTTGETI